MWNIPRYKFSKESEPSLINFIKVAREQVTQNRNCDLKNYVLWKTKLPLDPHLKPKVECDNENTTQQDPPTINLCSDEEMEETVSLPLSESKIVETSNKSTLNDIAYTIQDNVETENDLPENVREYLTKCTNTALEMIFQILDENLTSEGIYYLGVSIQNTISRNLIRLFCHHLLIPLIKKTYCDKIVNLLEQFSLKYPTILNEECLILVQSLEQHESEICLQYMKKLNVIFQTVLVRDFIFSIETLTKNYIILIDNLLNNQVEYEALSKLVQLLSNSCEDHHNDKPFGKLLMHTIDVLGPNLVRVEQALKHIIAGHKSIWKTKLEKAFKTSYEDSLLFSQSFRD
ncbi:uncharacterized protein LOC123011545 [Tribolium madens]|uniref:uncharacterized protein LOC123011545 n=1 Tax=Tribolium madens TaxID=41895 RepID=UPI001CF741A5|nr:uncharacterized protein LOC123011545 [Tribolium madens]XP_044264964.1 uncharacterized protein LOC123011545 [Tribolium madens]XP_044264965.1 uncharacterized protein LOC123011545 [Tribolium madens]XP_044264966.1 uncharacterized protein LOC123011545 [Tribolium madens]XP_044264967.1 uncharacterized protein LOC123011545 [Tribolium madens]XP_044264968.1 uncharacterized protein LOC123011545 [Tribolium madens]XP_044264970.1 uncharacterized protein LOC123011545 [Tribolium madens]XP_044264971.1 unc